ncbi:MAG: VTT domain-containing protein [Candidatus Hydrogenedentes bacterium]|nr:VTT domain-containing protein [Candidatus Hydrogenedentota bacterium]
MSFLKRLYEWVLSWAESPYGTIALFLLAFAESSFFPIPPDVLLIALCVGDPKKSFWFASVCSIGSILGGIGGYIIGYSTWLIVQDFFFSYVPGFTRENFEYVRNLYETHNFWVVFTAAFTPIPYKVITIAAGVCTINFPMFVIASTIGRSARFFLVGILIFFFGERIRTFIDKWFEWCVIAFTILLIGGFLVIKWWAS